MKPVFAADYAAGRRRQAVPGRASEFLRICRAYDSGPGLFTIVISNITTVSILPSRGAVMTIPRKRSAAGPQTKPAMTSRHAGRASGFAIRRHRPAPPRRPTRARLQTYFLRRLALSGSVADAAARTGVTPRTVQRWRAANAAFARRYEEVLSQRLEILEDLAMRRALRRRSPAGLPSRQAGRLRRAAQRRHADACAGALRPAARAPGAAGGGVCSRARRGSSTTSALLDAAGERARQAAILRRQEP